MFDPEAISDADAHTAITDTILNYAEYVDACETENGLHYFATTLLSMKEEKCGAELRLKSSYPNF